MIFFQIWFQNRRSKFKRQRQADHMNWMRKQIFQSKDDVNSGNVLGTPKLPALSSACHVLSPIETRIPRDDSTTDFNSLYVYIIILAIFKSCTHINDISNLETKN